MGRWSVGRSGSVPAGRETRWQLIGSGRVERRRDRFRPMASFCIRPFEHRGKQPSGHANVSSAPSIHSVRRVLPSTAGSQPCPPAPFRNPSRLRLTQELPFTRFWPIRIQASGTAAAPTGPWLSTVYHVRACKRYYGLMRRSDELRPAWASSAYSGRSLPLRAVRLTFPSLLRHTIRTCCDLYPVG